MRSTWIAAVAVTLLAAGVAYSVDTTASTASNPGISISNDNSKSLGSPSASSGSSSSTESTAQPSSSSQYPLVWGPNSPSGCYYDQYDFCVEAVLGFWANASIAFTATSSTTIINGNTTTVIHYDTVNTTTIFRTGTQTLSCQAAGNTTSVAKNRTSSSSTTCTPSISMYPITDFIQGPDDTSHEVAIFALVQNATTGQYITMGGGGSFVENYCSLNHTGYTRCYAPGYLSQAGPVPLSYKVTVFVTKGGLPCQLLAVGSSCSVPLLAPIQTIIVTE